jgi:hypothetical protein
VRQENQAKSAALREQQSVGVAAHVNSLSLEGWDFVGTL